MHTAFTDPISITPGWRADGFPREHGRDAAAAARGTGAAQARCARRRARRGVSYRSAWGVMGEGARLFGAPLVDMRRGRRASLSPLGRKVLAADQRVRRALERAVRAPARRDSRPCSPARCPRPRRACACAPATTSRWRELRALCAPQLDLEIDIQRRGGQPRRRWRATNASSPAFTSPTPCRVQRPPPPRSASGSIRASTTGAFRHPRAGIDRAAGRRAFAASMISHVRACALPTGRRRPATAR